MHHVRQEDLPFVGSSHQFVGADQGDVNVSVFLLNALPGRGPGPHRHPYDEVQFVREGRGLWVVNGNEFEAGAGDILVIKAGEIHSFRCIGDGPLVQLDVHLSPRFIQENLADAVIPGEDEESQSSRPRVSRVGTSQGRTRISRPLDSERSDSSLRLEMPSAMQPPFTTPRLEIAPAGLSDVDTLWALWTDPAVRRFLWDDREISRAEAAATVNDCHTLATRGLGLWVLVPRAEGEPSARHTLAAVGCAGLLPVTTAAEHEPRLAGLVEPLVALAPNVWGRGYASEALGALLSYASGTLGLPRLAGVTDVPNVASDRMLRRAGFTVLSETPGPRYPLRTYLWENAKPRRS